MTRLLKHRGVLKYISRRLLAPSAACAISLLLGGYPAASPAGDAPSAPAVRLERLRARIEALTRELTVLHGRHARIEAQLRDVERGLARTAARVRDVDVRLAAQRARLARLEARRRRLAAQLDAERHALARQVRAAYVLGGQPRLKLLLSQEDPAALARTLVYFDYFNRARTAAIRGVERRMQALAAVRREIDRQTAGLTALRTERVARARDFERRRAERRAVLARLDSQIHGKGAELERLRRDEARLKALLRQLQEAAAGIPRGPGPRRPFARLEGRLDWPTQGRIVARFGAPRLDSSLRWRGVEIAAPAGQPVRAIAYGRVVFADWLRGYGLLLIVDHGDGYMSLYGHNQALYVATGAWVKPGEVVASVGDSGGEARAALYFEIRRNGHPVNPARWCGWHRGGGRARR